jgi:hypothetical protein
VNSANSKMKTTTTAQVTAAEQRQISATTNIHRFPAKSWQLTPPYSFYLTSLDFPPKSDIKELDSSQVEPLKSRLPAPRQRQLITTAPNSAPRAGQTPAETTVIAVGKPLVSMPAVRVMFVALPLDNPKPGTSDISAIRE